MSSWIIVLLASIAAVALLIGGLSLTLIFKGRHMDSEIATNPHMKRLGIKCAVQEAREAEGAAACAGGSAAHSGGSAASAGSAGSGGSFGCSGNCSSCDIPAPEKAGH